MITDDLKEGTLKAAALGALRPLVFSCPPLRYDLSGLSRSTLSSQNAKSNQEVGSDIATELEAVRFVPGKIKPGLVPGPIALSSGEPVAKKRTPNEGLGFGSHCVGSGSVDTN